MITEFSSRGCGGASGDVTAGTGNGSVGPSGPSALGEDYAAWVFRLGGAVPTGRYRHPSPPPPVRCLLMGTTLTHISPTAPTTGPRSPLALGGAGGRAGRRTGWRLVLVLLALSAFAVWSSQVTSQASARAVTASGLSDDYAQAANAVGGEESLERKYRLEPGPQVQANYDKVAARFVAALGAVGRDGDNADRAFTGATLAHHRDYLRATDRLFRATDRRDTAAALKIDGSEVDPSFGAIEQAVLGAAETKHGLALVELGRLQHLERLTRVLTPVVFLLGLGLAGLLTSVMRGHRGSWPPDGLRRCMPHCTMR